MNLAGRNDDADVVSPHEPHLLVVFCSRYWNERHGVKKETQAVHELIPWNTMEDQVAENREARKTGETEKEHSAKRKGRGDWTIIAILVIPLNCHHTGRLKNTGSKAINTRSHDLRWPVTDSCKNSTVPNETVKAPQLTNCPK